MAGLLDALAEQGLISKKEQTLGQGLARISQNMGTTTRRKVETQGKDINDPYVQGLEEQSSYLQKQIDKQDARQNESGLLSTGNLTNNNPIVAGASNLLNFGVRTAGAAIDYATGVAGSVNVSNANDLYQKLPDEVKDIYAREKLDEQRNENNASLVGIQQALANGQEKDLVGYDKKFKTRTELDDRIKELQGKVNARPPTQEERALLDAPNADVISQNGLTSLRKNYRDVIGQIEQNYADDKMWRGERAKGEDNFFGTRAWGNDYAMQDMNQQYTESNKGNRDLDAQGKAQRADASITSGEYWDGWGKSLEAWKGSAGNAAAALKDNPAAFIDLAAETAPFLIGKTAKIAMLGDAGRVYADGAQDVTERTGQLGLEGGQETGVLAAAGAYAGLNLIERNTLLDAAKGLAPGSKALTELGDKASSVSSRLSTKIADALPPSLATTAKVLNAVTPTRLAPTLARNAATTAAVEGAVEMGQTQIEDSWSKLKTDVDASNLAQAGVLGAAMGAAFSAPGSVLEYAGKRITDNATAQVEQQLGSNTDTDEDLLNAANPSYAPEKVVNRILATDVKNGDMDGAKAKVDQIVGDINNKLSGLKERAKAIADPQVVLDRIAKGEQVLANFQANNTPESNPNYAKTLEVAESKIQGLRDLHAEITAPEFDSSNEVATIARMEKSLAAMEGTYKAFNDAYSQQQAAKTKAAEAASAEQEAASDPVDTNTPPTEEAAPAEPVVETTTEEATRHLGAPTASNLARITELANDSTVPEALRNNLRIVSDALIAANKKKDAGKVSKDVTKGDVGFRGTEQYLEELSKAIKSGDTGRIESLTTQIDYFTKSRESKLKAIQEAQELANSTGKPVQVVKPDNREWLANTGKNIPNSEFAKNNGIIVNPVRSDGTKGATKLLEAITNDLAEIKQTKAAMEAMQGIPADSFNGQVNDLRDGYKTADNAANYDPVQEAIDEMNRQERLDGRDTSARDNDPNAKVVDPLQPNAAVDSNSEAESVDQEGPFEGMTEDAIPLDYGNESESDFDIDPRSEEEFQTDINDPRSPHFVPDESVTEQAKPVERKAERYSAKSEFKTEEEGNKYLKKHKRESGHSIVKGDTGFIIAPNVPVAEQPTAESDKVTTVANENNVANPVTDDFTDSQLNVSESYTESNQVDTRTNEAIVELEANTEQTATVDVSPEGGISQMDTNGESTADTVKAERKKPFKLQNLLKSGFIQKIRDGLNSPLVAQKDFISSVKVRSRAAIVDMVLKYTGKTASEAQVILVNDFMNFNKSYGVNKHIRKLLKAQNNPEYAYKAMSDFFLDESGELDENTATAIAASIYAWVGENATSLYADKREMGKILGIKNADDIPASVQNRISTIGSHQKTLAATLGQRAYQSLQLKMLKDVDPSRQSKVEQMLGTVAIGAMVSMGLAERSRISNGELYTMAQLTEGTIDSLDPKAITDKQLKKLDKDRLTDKAFTYFIRPATQNVNGRLFPTPYNQRILDLHKDTKGILSTIFGFTPYTQLPSLEPVTTLPNTFNEFEGQLPEMVKTALLKQQALKHRLNVPMVELAIDLLGSNKGTEALRKILGYEDPMNRHVAFEKAVISKNIGIDRSIRLLMDTYDKVEDNVFYLPSEVWSNLRNGNPAGFNPQGDKIHRGFVALDNDLITVPLDDRKPFKEDGSLSEYGMFLRGLGFRLEDVKVNKNAVDKTLVVEFLPQFEEYISSPEVTTAANSLNSMLSGEYAQSDLDNVSNLLAKWDMAALGLSGLMTINARNQAIKSGATSFDVYLAADSDGLVNGPAITNIMLNSGNAEFYRSVGIFPQAGEGEIQLDSVQQLRKDPTALDPYEQLAALQKLNFDALPHDDTILGLAVRALGYLDPDYGKRAGAKRALTPFNYGSGMDSVNRANARGTLNTVYTKIEEAGRLHQTASPEESYAAAVALSKAINVLINYSNQNLGPKAEMTTPESIADMGQLLSPAQEAAIKNADFFIRGGATEAALTTLMSSYISLRNGKTSQANAAFDMFAAVYASLERRAIADKIASGTANTVVTKTGKTEAVEVLTAEDKQQLLRSAFKYMPTLATPQGIKSGQDSNNGIPMVDVGTKWNTDKTIEIVFNASFGHLFTPESTNGPTKENSTTTLKSDIREKSFETPGVGSVALYIQSHDAYVTYMVMQAMDAQNNHDSNSTNAYDLEAMGRVQNEAFLDAVTISHMGKAFSEGMLKAVEGVVAESANMTAKELAGITASLRSMYIANGVLAKDDKGPLDHSSLLTKMVADSFQKDIDKLTYLKQQHSIHQYATEGGGYIITEGKRNQIENRKADLIKARDEALNQSTRLGTSLNSSLGNKPPVAPKGPTAESVLANKVEAATTVDSFHQELIDNKAKLSNPQELIKHVQKNLGKYLQSNGKQGRYATTYNELLKLASIVIDGTNLEVNIIDGTENTDSILGYDQAVLDGTVAWYSHKGGKAQINLRVTTGEKINSKVITHEFLHAATSAAIDMVRANPKAYPKAAESLGKLERLYDHVKSKVTTADNKIVQYGITNIDEFIATGLTYPEFMDYLDNIVDIPKESRSRGRISTAFRAMVSHILDALYAVGGKGRTYSTKTLSAYEALLLDTAEFVSNSPRVKQGDQLKMLGAPRASAINTVSQYTALEVFESLDDNQLDPKFKAILGGVITSVTDKLFSALPHKFAQSKSNYSPEQLWQRALDAGKTPYMTGALAAGFSLTAQEQFGVEAIEIALAEATKAGSVSAAYKLVSKSFDEAKAKLSPKDFVYGSWDTATAEQKQAAEKKYDYIFKVGDADYITRFTAMALASQEFNQLLDIKLNTDMFADRGKPAFDKLIDYANKAINYATEKLTNTKGTNTIQGKLPRLAEVLIEIDLKNRNKAVNKLESYLLNTEALANDVILGARNKLNEAALNSPLSMFNNKYVNIITNTLKATKDGRSVISVFDALRDFRNTENPNERLGFMGELANEIGDQNKSQLLAEKLLAYAKQNEGTAQRIRTVVKEDVLSRFKDKGANLTREQRAAVTQALLRTDAQSLIANYGYDGLIKLVTDRAELHKEIRKLESQVKDPIKLSRTKSLGYYMVSGRGTETLAKNPTLIAQNAGMGIMSMPSDNEIKLIDDLASLYALKHTDGKTLKQVAEVIESEKDGVDGGGIYALVKYHESLAAESYETLFSNNIGSYTKGYLPNISNPHREIVVATTIADKERLRAAMYTEIGEVAKAEIDPSNSNTAVMFYTEDAGSQRHISGGMALYNNGRKGTEIELTLAERIDAINAAVASIDTDPNFNPGERTSIAAIPSYDTNGSIMAYNYEMSGLTRDTYLERNNDFAALIGEYTASGFNKVTQSDQNINVANALIDHYRTAYASDPNGFIYVGAGVSDNTLSQAWAMIPKETRDHIYKRTGNNGIYVHNQAFLTIFGTKKYSLTETFDKHADMQNMAESLFTGLMRALFKDNARIRTARGERMWQEMVTALKDFVIIRNMSTALVNILSNSFLLMAHGVSPKDIVTNTIQAVKAGGEYRKNSAELIKLQNRQRVEIGNTEEIQQRINILQQRIDKNPLKNFIDEGMFAGIIEDIDTDNQSYTYASGLQTKYEGVIDKVPKTVRNVARYAFVQPSTPLYQFLHSATQYGDFSAKYVMYKHFTEKAKVRLTHDAAITKASNNFINYDVPTSKGMQYANDMGLLMFTKYNLRIQRALFELMGKRPASAIGQAIVINALSNLPPGIDPMVFNQIGNPLRSGPLGLLGAWDEPFPIQILKSVF